MYTYIYICLYNIFIYVYTYIYIHRLACNTRVIVDAISNPPVFNVKLLQQKPSINSSSKQTNIASSINHSNGNSIRW